MGRASFRRDWTGRRRAAAGLRHALALTSAAVLWLALALPRAGAQSEFVKIVDGLAAIDLSSDDSAERALRAFEFLHAEEQRGEVVWSQYDWRVYASAAALLATDPVWSAALPEAPRPLLERLAADPRTAPEKDLPVLLETVICILLRDEGRIAEAAGRTLTALACIPMGADSRCMFWTEVARDRGTLGDYGAALAALENAEAELDVLRATTTDEFLSAVHEFDLQSARMAIELQLGRPDRAARSLARIRELAPLVTDEQSAEQWLRDECDFALASDDLERLIQRLESLRASEGLAPQVADSLGRAYLLTRKGAPDRLERASELFEEVLAHPGSSRIVSAHARIGLAMARREQGRFDSAAELLDQARSGANSVLELEIVTERAALAMERGEPHESLAEVHRELLRGFERILRHWDSIPAQPDGAGFTNYVERRAPIIELLHLEVALDRDNGAQRALQRWLSAEARGSLAREFRAQLPDESELRQRLFGAGSGALIFIPGPRRSALFALDSGRVELFNLPASDTWNEAQRELGRLLATPPHSERDLERRRRDYRALADELAQFLLPPRARERLASWEELTIVGLDMLGYLPFECLALDGEELGLSKAISYAPSLLLQGELDQRWRASGATPRQGMRWLAAPSDPTDAAERFGWEAIDWDGRRAERLRELWGDRVRVDHGPQANWAALQADSGADLAVLEILAHGYYDATQSPPAGVALAPTREHAGYIASAQIAGLSAPPIVAFAVCGAARGPLRSGDEATGHLGGAALRAGASVVLLATLDIEQAASEALLDTAYRAMVRDGATPAQALRVARRSLSEDEETSDPHYRNVLHCVGLGHAALVQQSRPSGAKWLGPTVALIAIAAALFALWRRRSGATELRERAASSGDARRS